MTVVYLRERSAPALEVRACSAYELLLGLCGFGLRRAAGVKDGQEVGEELASGVADLADGFPNLWAHLLGIARETAGDRNAAAFVERVEATGATELYLHLLGYYLQAQRGPTLPEVIARAADGDEAAIEELLATSFPEDTGWQATLRRLLALGSIETRRRTSDLLRGWYETVLRPREQEILELLERDAREKRALAGRLPVERLIELAVGSVELAPPSWAQRVELVPSLGLAPWVLIAEHKDTQFLCYPVEEETLRAEPTAPPEYLVRLGKALGDESRLRVLKLLASDSRTLQEIADALGLAKSTAHHHLALLRRAGLVRVRPGERLYSLRPEALRSFPELLASFLEPAEEATGGKR